MVLDCCNLDGCRAVQCDSDRPRHARGRHAPCLGPAVRELAAFVAAMGISNARSFYAWAAVMLRSPPGARTLLPAQPSASFPPPGPLSSKSCCTHGRLPRIQIRFSYVWLHKFYSGLLVSLILYVTILLVGYIWTPESDWPFSKLKLRVSTNSSPRHASMLSGDKSSRISCSIHSMQLLAWRAKSETTRP